MREGGAIAGVAIHAGLWTSAALSTKPDKVPLLRQRLAALEEKYGFDPRGHAGKALRRTLSVLPHDLLIGFTRADAGGRGAHRHVAHGPAALEAAAGRGATRHPPVRLRLAAAR